MTAADIEIMRGLVEKIQLMAEGIKQEGIITDHAVGAIKSAAVTMTRILDKAEADDVPTGPDSKEGSWRCAACGVDYGWRSALLAGVAPLDCPRCGARAVKWVAGKADSIDLSATITQVDGGKG